MSGRNETCARDVMRCCNYRCYSTCALAKGYDTGAPLGRHLVRILALDRTYCCVGALQTPILSTAHILYDVIVTHPSSYVCLLASAFWRLPVCPLLASGGTGPSFVATMSNRLVLRVRYSDTAS